MTHDIPITFALPAVARRKFTAAFDGGWLSSDTGVLLLSFAERRRRIAEIFCGYVADPRDLHHITHTVIRQRRI